jgi:hypothetical protein
MTADILSFPTTDRHTSPTPTTPRPKFRADPT